MSDETIVGLISVAFAAFIVVKWLWWDIRPRR